MDIALSYKGHLMYVAWTAISSDTPALLSGKIDSNYTVLISALRGECTLEGFMNQCNLVQRSSASTFVLTYSIY